MSHPLCTQDEPSPRDGRPKTLRLSVTGLTGAGGAPLGAVVYADTFVEAPAGGAAGDAAAGDAAGDAARAGDAAGDAAAGDAAVGDAAAVDAVVGDAGAGLINLTGGICPGVNTYVSAPS